VDDGDNGVAVMRPRHSIAPSYTVDRRVIVSCGVAVCVGLCAVR